MKKRADGRWLKVKTVNGKKVHFYSKASTEKQAIKDIEKQMMEYEAKAHSEKHNFLKIAEQMLEKKEATTSYNNVTNYKNQLKHLEPLYDFDIEEISVLQLQNLFNNMHSQSYGYWTLQKTKTVLGLIYKEAILSGCAVTNLVEFIKIPSQKKEPVHSPDDEIISIVKKSANNEFGMWAMMLLCTGMRRGELAAIQKKDINFSRKIISVTKSVEYVHNQPNIKTPKTQSGVRSVPIIDILYPSLSKYCSSLSDNDFLFGGVKPYTITMLRRRWNNYLKSAGVSITQHQLRHAYAFLLYRSGVDIKSAQYLLGHSNYETTMNIYTDFDRTKIDATSALLNSTLNSI